MCHSHHPWYIFHFSKCALKNLRGCKQHIRLRGKRIAQIVTAAWFRSPASPNCTVSQATLNSRGPNHDQTSSALTIHSSPCSVRLLTASNGPSTYVLVREVAGSAMDWLQREINDVTCAHKSGAARGALCGFEEGVHGSFQTASKPCLLINSNWNVAKCVRYVKHNKLDHFVVSNVRQQVQRAESCVNDPWEE